MDKEKLSKTWDGIKGVGKKAIDGAKKSFDKLSKNVKYYQKSDVFYIVDGNKGEKITNINGILTNDVVFIKKDNFLSNEQALIKGNVLIKKNTCEMFEILAVDNKKTYEYLLEVNGKYETLLSYKLDVKKITKII